MVSVAMASEERLARRDEDRRVRPASRPAGRPLPRESSTVAREDVDHRQSLIAQLPLFAGLDSPVLQVLAENAELRRIEQGQFVIRAGESGRFLFGVIFGQVQLLWGDPAGDPAVLALIGPGHTFSEATMWLGTASPVSARATQDSLVVAIPREPIDHLIARHSAVAVRFLSCISRSLHHLVANIGSHKQKSGEQRLAAYLLGLPDANGGAGQPRVKLPASKGTIASLVSIQPETLSRILRRFQQNGWIEMRGRELTIAREDALRDLAESPAQHRH